MNRYIDADALYEYITNKFGGVDCSILLDEKIAPSITIVWCNKCKYCTYDKNENLYKCTKEYIEHMMYEPSIHFCSYGKYKE